MLTLPWRSALDAAIGHFYKLLEDDMKLSSDTSLQHVHSAVDDPSVAERYSLRYVYTHSCREHSVCPNKLVLQQLPPVVGTDWARKVNVLDFSLVYLGNEGCVPLVPVIALCTAVTHIAMPSVGLGAKAVRPLLAVLQAHPTLTWINLSGNHLDDDVGRWILNMVLENRRIRFVLLQDTGISPPLIRKIEFQLQQRNGGHVGRGCPRLVRASGLKALSLSHQCSFTSSLCSCKATRTHRIPALAAAGLAGLRHRLHYNRHNLQYVYNCFLTPFGAVPRDSDSNDGGGEDTDACVNITKVGDNGESVPVLFMQSEHCSWRAFFHALRLLGIHVVSRSLAESVTFATICGICNLDAICFRKLLDFLRPHVALRAATPPPPPPPPTTPTADLFPINGHSGPVSSETTGDFCSSAGSRPGISSAFLAGCANSMPIDTKSTSEAQRSLLERHGAVEKGEKPVVEKKILSEARTASDSLESVPAADGNNVVDFNVLEDKFKLQRTLSSRKAQYVLDRLYDARATLRKSLQQVDETDSIAPHMAHLEKVVVVALSFLGEDYRETLMTLLEPWKADVGAWLDAMYIRETGTSALPPFPLSEEKRMWMDVGVEDLRRALKLW